MTRFDLMPIGELIRPEGHLCSCGRRHVCALKYLNVGKDALSGLPDMIAAMGRHKPFVVCDGNTWKAAGARVDEILTAAGIEHKCYVIPGERISPAEWETGSVLMHFDPACDMFLAVGSGVINDTCKVLAHAVGVPCAVVGTAPSMDGYASNSSSMELNHVKVSLYNRAPEGILLDTGILAQAPMRMLQAGFGDMIAKYVSLCEWRISNLVTGEYYCPATAQLMRAAVAKVTSAAERIPQRDPDAIQTIAEGLVLAGVAMAFAQISRPASGLEHYFSHMWEMMALERGKPYDLHGIQVGVGTMITLKLYRDIRKIVPDRAAAQAHMDTFDEAAWRAQIRRIFGKTADEVLAIEEKARKNDPEKHAARLTRILSNWDEITRIMDEELPDYASLRAKAEAVGMPLRPSDLGLPVRDAVDAFLGSRDIRDKYLTSSMLWDLGLTDEYADKVAEVCEE